MNEPARPDLSDAAALRVSSCPRPECPHCLKNDSLKEVFVVLARAMWVINRLERGVDGVSCNNPTCTKEEETLACTHAAFAALVTASLHLAKIPQILFGGSPNWDQAQAAYGPLIKATGDHIEYSAFLTLLRNGMREEEVETLLRDFRAAGDFDSVIGPVQSAPRT